MKKSIVARAVEALKATIQAIRNPLDVDLEPPMTLAQTQDAHNKRLSAFIHAMPVRRVIESDGIGMGDFKPGIAAPGTYSRIKPTDRITPELLESLDEMRARNEREHTLAMQAAILAKVADINRIADERASTATNLPMQNGWTSDGRKQVDMVPFRNERECHYTVSPAGLTDPSCAGCQWRRQPENRQPLPDSKP